MISIKRNTTGPCIKLPFFLQANQSASSAGDFMDRSKNFMSLGNIAKDLIKNQPILDMAFVSIPLFAFN